MKKLRVSIALIIAIVSSVLLVGCSTSNGDKVYSINQEINLGDITFKVTGIERLDSIDDFKPKVGNEFLVVKYVIKNNTNDSKECSRIQFELESKNNKEIKSTFIPEDTKGSQDLKVANDKAVPAKGKLEGSVIFQVKKDSTGYILEYEPEVIDIDAINVKLN